MLVSFRHKFIYVKGRKVASTSIEMALAPLCGPNDIVTPITPADEFERLSLGGQCQNYCQDERLANRYLKFVKRQNFEKALKTGVYRPQVSVFYNHMPLADIERRLEIPFEEYVLVISERSPYWKIISFANMKLSFAGYHGQRMVNSPRDIRRCVDELFGTGQYLEVRNIELYRGRERYKEVVLLRQESLDRDLTKLFSHLELGPCPAQWPHAKKGTTGLHLDPRAMLTREQLDRVNLEFADEFERFGFERL